MTIFERTGYTTLYITISSFLLANSPFPVLAQSPRASTELHIAVTGDEKPLFLWSRDRCDLEDIPDANARTFRDSRGRLNLIASNSDTRISVFDDSGSPTRPCNVVLPSSRDPNPSNYADKSWITSVWTQDGTTVHALVHHEFHAHQHPNTCILNDYVGCWYNTITYARSDDGGQTFQQSTPPAVVASVPFTQDFAQGRRRGFFGTSNIVYFENKWWMFSYTSGWAGQKSGSCLFQTADIASPTSWRAFDGTAFVAQFPDPYIQSAGPTSTCLPIFENSVGSITRFENRFVAVYIAADNYSLKDPNFYVYYRTSKDLVNWGKPNVLMPINDVSSVRCGDKSRYAYPSLLQDEELQRDGASAVLTLVRFNVRNCRNTLDRDLISIPVIIN
ncbi:hypothetical protein [Blastochloris sulfoviridis]|uniref:Exo-alpha-sialidase n=1 Tax=Blastochloris sulfoviridis TaxID=50712 RepID=A0A5M6HJI7_9HYPH|nr:hypothetical protein [Blastochloris sulfoviridis]KAA5595961.1 hypothetical protein F1193_16010 [Blastochloris sulfoviridis]